MDPKSQRVHFFMRTLSKYPWISALWSTYHAVHKWPERWDDVSKEQLDEAFAWIDRLKRGQAALLTELQACLNLPEEE